MLSVEFRHSVHRSNYLLRLTLCLKELDKFLILVKQH